MNVLFLTLLDFYSYNESNIYCDLLRELINDGHDVYCISPSERRYNIKTHFEENNHLLKLKIGNTQKTNVIEKGISTILIEPTFKKAIKTYFADVKFDLVLYSTPPITLLKAVKYTKKRDGAKTYLMLKDIFPQNAVDLDLMQKKGPKAVLYNYFRKKEKQLYAISDWIGCMSQANAEYLKKHNPEVNPSIVQICPNAIEPKDLRLSAEEKISMRNKYGIPTDRKVFIYGGNLGKPQGIPFIIDCLRGEKNNEKAFFLIVGDGTEYGKLETFVKDEKPGNIKLMKRLPKEDYDRLISACDVGLIFLDHRFTIPNFPSRLLSYMQAGLPILACTDPNTDIGRIIVDGQFGWWCESNKKEQMHHLIRSIIATDISAYAFNSFEYCINNYTVSIVKDIILNNMDKCL